MPPSVTYHYYTSVYSYRTVPSIFDNWLNNKLIKNLKKNEKIIIVKALGI